MLEVLPTRFRWDLSGASYDVLVIKLTNSLHLTYKKAKAFLLFIGVSVVGRISPNDFDSNAPGKLQIIGQIDFTHATSSEPTNDAVVSKLLSFS